MSRFKTELCNNLIELGTCKYGDRCHYAHGAHELRQVSRRHPKYRTETCKNFELTGKCPFGPRCSYVHPKPDLDSMIEQLTKYMKHTKAPKPDSEDDDDGDDVSLFTTRTENSSISTSCNSMITTNDDNDENKENHLVVKYQVSTLKSIDNHQFNTISSSKILNTPVINSGGATSHTISDTSKTSINQLNNHYRASFMDFILDASLVELLQSSANVINKDLANLYSSNHKSTATKIYQQSQTVCTQLSNVLSVNQMKFCIRHQDVLESILPQVIQLTYKECTRITHDLRWNCPSIEYLLDRSNPLAFTREAALVRSILNASMMYLVLKTCIEASNRSCGCLDDQRFSFPGDKARKENDRIFELLENKTKTSGQHYVPLKQEDLSTIDLSKLTAGSPIRLTKSINQRQGCLANTAFANAFTKLFIDSDDSKALNKAQRVLNEDYNYNDLSNRVNFRRLAESDYKDLAYIKWTKAAINMHNNHIGRQLVRDAIHRRCRCHGLSGMCQYQTCWDQLRGFDTITSKLREIYLAEATKAFASDSGTFDRPDLHLAKLMSSNQPPGEERDGKLKNSKVGSFPMSDLSSGHLFGIVASQLNKIKVESKELLYLYDSPEYCKPEINIRYQGTKGRACALLNNITEKSKTSKKNINNAELFKETGYTRSANRESLQSLPGSCERICCDRGYRSELILDMVTCNCRFKFCCRVECDLCLSQQMQHFCL